MGATCYDAFDIRFQSCDVLRFPADACRWLWSPTSFRRAVLPQHRRRQRNRDLDRQAELARTFGGSFFILILDRSDHLVGVGTDWVFLPLALATFHYDWNGFSRRVNSAALPMAGQVA